VVKRLATCLLQFPWSASTVRPLQLRSFPLRKWNAC
jgi:hypothetical protein